MEYGTQSHWQVRDQTGRRKYLSAGERARFLAEADQLDLAHRALCYVLAYTGCRISEALALTTDRIDAEQLTLTFRTLKRRRVIFREVPIPAHLLAMVRDLQPAADGRIWPVHRSTAWRWIKTVMIAARIRGPMASCKGCRHGFGIRAATQRVPPVLIQRWLGHASPSTTAIYVDAVGVEERQFAMRMW